MNQKSYVDDEYQEYVEMAERALKEPSWPDQQDAFTRVFAEYRKAKGAYGEKRAVWRVLEAIRQRAYVAEAKRIHDRAIASTSVDGVNDALEELYGLQTAINWKFHETSKVEEHLVGLGGVVAEPTVIPGPREVTQAKAPRELRKELAKVLIDSFDDVGVHSDRFLITHRGEKMTLFTS